MEPSIHFFRLEIIGMVRTPVACSHGVREVVGSNPAIPTTQVHQNPKACKSYDLRAFLFFMYQFDLDNFSKNETYPVNQMNGLF